MPPVDEVVQNEFGQQVGFRVDGWIPPSRPGPMALHGRTVRLEPLSTEHAAALFDALCGPDDGPLWTYLWEDRPADLAALEAMIGSQIADPTTECFALVDIATGRAVGRCSLMRIDPANGSIEVGSIAYGRILQRTIAATEAMYLLARHVFDALGYRRYEWKCNSLNEPSRSAAVRLGFSYEGRFRQAMVAKGHNRDTDWYSIIDSDWPSLRAAFEAWLDPANFDEDGRQRSPLAEHRVR